MITGKSIIMDKQLTAPDIVAKVKALGLPLGEYAVCGGAVLAVRSMRSTQDIDMIVTQKIYDRLREEGWKEKIRPDSDRSHILLEDPFDVSVGWSVNDYKPDSQRLISSAELIEGIPFVALQEVLRWKRACRRPKDIRDIQLIEHYARSHDS